MLNRFKLLFVVIFLILFCFVSSVFADVPQREYFKYNFVKNLLYLNNSISQLLIGGTATTTNAKLEVQGGLAFDNATGTGRLIVSSASSTEYCLSGNCFSAWTDIKNNPFNQWLDSTSSVAFATTTLSGLLTVNNTSTRNIAAHCSDETYDNQGDCETNGGTWHPAADNDFITNAESGGYNFFSPSEKNISTGVYGYATSTDYTSGGETISAGVFGLSSGYGVIGAGGSVGGLFYSPYQAIYAIGESTFIGAAHFYTNQFNLGEEGNPLLSISATSIGVGQYSAPSEFLGVQPSVDAGEIATARFKTWNNTDQLFLDSTGRVGVATTTPGGYYGEKLTVVGDSYFQGNATTTGHLAVLGGNSDQWNTAYSWGNWSTGIWASSTLSVILSNAQTAFSWGNHALAGYLTQAIADLLYQPIGNYLNKDTDHYVETETDPIFMAASTSLPYIAVETDPIWTAASSSYLKVADWESTTTDSLAEGLTNLYYSDTRVGTYINSSTTIQDYFSKAYTAIQTESDPISLHLSDWFATTTWAGGNNLLVNGNVTSTGYIAGGSGSKFGSNGVYTTFDNYDFFGEGSLILPRTSFQNTNSIGFPTNFGMIDKGFGLIDTSGVDQPLIALASADFNTTGLISYATTTGEIVMIPNSNAPTSTYLTISNQDILGGTYPTITAYDENAEVSTVMVRKNLIISSDGNPFLAFYNELTGAYNIFTIDENGLLAFNGLSALRTSTSTGGLKEAITASGSILGVVPQGSKVCTVYKDGVSTGLFASRYVGATCGYANATGASWYGGLTLEVYDFTTTPTSTTAMKLTSTSTTSYFDFISQQDLEVWGSSTTTNSSYLGTSAGLNGVYITNWSDIVSSYGWSTSSEQYFWNNTSTWWAYDSNWARNYNATSTFGGNLRIDGNVTTTGSFEISSGIILKDNNSILQATTTNLFIGNNSGKNIAWADTNTFIGYNVGSNSSSTNYYSQNTFLGYQAGQYATSTKRELQILRNVFIGDNAGQYSSANSSSANAQNVFIGSSAGQFAKTGSSILIGLSAGSNSSGDNTIVIGTNSGINISGTSNICVGNNTCIGYMTGINNSIFGSAAGAHITSGSRNTCYGRGSCASLTEGKDNLMSGIAAGDMITTGDNNVFLGANVGVKETGNVSNRLMIDSFQSYSASDDRTLIWGDFSQNWLTFNATKASTTGDFYVAGKVGIGTTTPKYAMTVASSTDWLYLTQGIYGLKFSFDETGTFGLPMISGLASSTAVVGGNLSGVTIEDNLIVAADEEDETSSIVLASKSFSSVAQLFFDFNQEILAFLGAKSYAFQSYDESEFFAYFDAYNKEVGFTGTTTIGMSGRKGVLRMRDSDDNGWSCFTSLNGTLSGYICD